MNHRLRRLGLAPMLALLIGLIALGSVAARQTSPPAPVWTYEFTDGAAYGLGLSEDGGTLIAVVGFGFDTGGTIISLDPATGEEIWAFSTEEGASADPIVVDGVVYAGMGSLVGGGAAVYALDATAGAELWRADIMNHELPATPVDAVVFADGKLFVNRADATLLKLDAASGQIEWSLDIQKPSRGAPAVAGDTVYVSTGFDGARILAIDNQDGTVRWSVEDPVNPVTGPVLANGFLYVPFVDGELAALDPATGDELWRSYVGVLDEEVGIHPNPGLPLIIGDTIFVSSNGFAGAYTVALDAQSGQELWMTKTGDFSAEMPALFGEALLVGSDNGDLLALDPATGTERWRIPVSNRIEVALDQSSPPLTANGLIFVRNEIGSVVALGLAA